MHRIILGCLLLLSIAGWSQEEKSFKDRLYFNGGLQAGFSNSLFVIGASPSVGYMWTEKLSTGLGISFIYYSLNSPAGKYQTSIYGGNAFTRYLFFDNFFAQTEYHMVNSDVPVYDTSTQSLQIKRSWIPMWYVGGGYRAPLGGRAFATITVLYDLIDNRYSPYSNPTIRGGISFGF
ncbi:MAG: hypothetical protein KDC12_12350 [Flavobacteriales bacterium]|nr:hypothetical protein [Flavobacteriales bacterium]